jgi:head-tail adaptor
MKWPSIDPGRLRHQITIFRQVTVQGTSGPKAGFVPFVSAYAAIEPLSATDVVSSGQTVSQLGIPIFINWQAGIEPNMQVEALGNRYIIRDVINPFYMNVSLTLMCIALKDNE